MQNIENIAKQETEQNQHNILLKFKEWLTKLTKIGCRVFDAVMNAINFMEKKLCDLVNTAKTGLEILDLIKRCLSTIRSEISKTVEQVSECLLLLLNEIKNEEREGGSSRNPFNFLSRTFLSGAVGKAAPFLRQCHSGKAAHAINPPHQETRR